MDYTSAAPEGYIPVENITFPSMSRLKDGLYTFKIHNWALRSPTTSGFKAEIEFDGQVFEYEHTQPLGQKEWVTVAEATLKNGKFTIEHKLSSTASSQEKWGIQTETFVIDDGLWVGVGVFEILGDKTKCQPTDDQLSGLGFSSTRGDVVTVKVAGPKLNKSFTITF